MDLYKRYWRKGASEKSLVLIGRVMTVVFVIIACAIAPNLANPKFEGVFHYIQEFQGYISPGIVAAFVFGFLFKRAPAAAGVMALILTAPVYGFLHWQFSGIAFLNRMAMTFGIVFSVMGVMTICQPLAEPKVLPLKQDYSLKPSPLVITLGCLVVAAVVCFYIVFW